jgi:hypothetical protein
MTTLRTRGTAGRHNTLECKGVGLEIINGANDIEALAAAGERLLRLEAQGFKVASKMSKDDGIIALHHGTDGCALCRREVELLELHR